jgi:hypothetical protein
MKIQAFSVPPQIQSEDFTSKINRQNLPISNSVDNKEHINFEGFTKCLTYQMALAAEIDRQTILQKQILRQETKGLLDSKN